MLSAADQIDRITDIFVRAGGVLLAGSGVTVGDDDLSAYAEVSFQFPGEHRLYVTLAIDVIYGYPFWALYAFQFQDSGGRTLFRYDNWPDYPVLESFPHHKHIGADERVEAHPQPSLAMIVREIQQYT